MTTTAQELLSKPLKIKPLLSKSLHTSDTKSLSLTNIRKEMLQSLTIQGELWKSVQGEHKTLNRLKKILNTSKALKKFRLNARICGLGDEQRKKNIDKALVRIIESFKNHSALVNIDFFCGEQGGNENTLRIITKGVGHVMTRVREFAFGTSFWYLYGREKDQLLVNRGLKRLPLLQRIDVSTPWFNEVSIHTFEEWEHSLFVNKNLKELSLNLAGHYPISSEFLVRMGDNLPRFPCVKNLWINFNSWTYLKIESLVKLMKRTLEMPSLEGIYLRLFDCHLFTNDWMRIFCENLAKLVRITRLELNFDKCQKINNEGIGFVSQCLQQLQQKLTWIKLDFSRCTNINAKGLGLLGETLKNMKELKEVHIILECCGKINIEDVECFVKDFGEMSVAFNVTYQRSRKDEKVCRKN